MAAALASTDEKSPKRVRLDSTADWEIREEPDGAFLASGDLIAAASADDTVATLEALEPLLLPSQPAELRAAAALQLADALRDAGRAGAADRILAKARAEAENAPNLSEPVRRWVGVRTAPDASDSRFSEWLDDVARRGTDIEELVLLRDAARYVGAGDTARARLAARLALPSTVAGIRAAAARLDPSRSALVCVDGRCFGVDASRHDAVDLGAADASFVQPAPGPEAGVRVLTGSVRTPELDIDLGPFAARVPFTTPVTRGMRLQSWLGSAVILYGAMIVFFVWAVARQQRRADELLVAREELIARVTHELRTPLTVLRMYGESLAAGRVPADAREDYVRTMSVESERLGRIVDRVAAAARGDAQEEGPGATEANAAIDDAISRARPVVEERGGTIGRRGGESVEFVTTSADDLRLILDVLIDNATKYGGTPASVEVEIDRAVDSVRITVRDHGPGVAPAERPRLFERWFRGAEGVKSREGGAGMGLFLARRAARAAGGDLVLEFPADGGTRAVVTIPAAREPAR